MYIQTYKDFLTEQEGDAIMDYLHQPVFAGVQTSNGNFGHQRVFFKAPNLHEVSLFTNLIPKIKSLFPEPVGDLERCWAIAHQTGSHGDFHQDEDTDDYYSAVLYPHKLWHADWGGETVFFDPEKYEIIKSVLPLPLGIAVFKSNIHHCARPTTTHYLGIRYVINYMFKVKT